MPLILSLRLSCLWGFVSHSEDSTLSHPPRVTRREGLPKCSNTAASVIIAAGRTRAREGENPSSRARTADGFAQISAASLLRHCKVGRLHQAWVSSGPSLLSLLRTRLRAGPTPVMSRTRPCGALLAPQASGGHGTRNAR